MVNQRGLWADCELKWLSLQVLQMRRRPTSLRPRQEG